MGKIKEIHPTLSHEESEELAKAFQRLFAFKIIQHMCAKDFTFGDIADKAEMEPEPLIQYLSGRKNMTLQDMCDIAYGVDMRLEPHLINRGDI